MTSTSWLSRSQIDQPPTQGFNLHHPSSHQVPLTPSYITPRSAPEPPPLTFQKPLSSSLRSIQNALNRIPSLSRSHTTDSLQSGSTAISRSFEPANSVNHPYATMPPAPLPVVSNHDPSDDEEECPVCLEPLSFSFRLPGEKPHIVPECGHALHEVSICSENTHYFFTRCGASYY
jgi:hypothetical protein